MKNTIVRTKIHKLTEHGLIESELKRKYTMYVIVRNDYHDKKINFIKSFLKLGSKLKDFENVPSKVKSLKPKIKKIYDLCKSKFNELKISKERFLEFLNSILKSIANVLGIGGIVSEYKDSLEIATKKELTPQFNIIVFNFGPKLLPKMKNYLIANA